MQLDQAVIDAVFTKAEAGDAHWVTVQGGTRLGKVNHNGETYTIEIHGSGRTLAHIAWVYGRGGTIAVHGANASQAQHQALWKASSASLAAKNGR